MYSSTNWWQHVRVSNDTDTTDPQTVAIKEKRARRESALRQQGLGQATHCQPMICQLHKYDITRERVAINWWLRPNII
jgi:hypothetical protein